MKNPNMLIALEPLRDRRERNGVKGDRPEPERVLIGIDPGTRCGIAWKVGRSAMQVATKGLLDTMALLTKIVQEHGAARVKVWVEDARMNRPVFDRGVSRQAMQRIAQNVGSVKRDTDLLEQHCKTLGVNPMMVRPTTAKWTPAMMRAATGIERSSQHARDAAKLIAGRGGR